MRSILITGVQGVGKSILAKDAASQLGVECWNYGDLMLRVDPDLGTKDRIPYLDHERRTAIYRKVDGLLDQLLSFAGRHDEYLFLENHLSIIDETGVHTFSHEHARRSRPLGLAVIEATPETIIARRQQDLRRYRRLGTVAEIAEQQEVNRAESALIVAMLDIPTAIVSNEGDPREGAHALAEFANRAVHGLP